MYEEKDFVLIGIDPGSQKFGISKFIVDIDTLQIKHCKAWTIHSEKLSQNSEWTMFIHSDRVSRLNAIEEYMYELFITVKPLVIVSEAPFINHRFPQAGIVLTEVMSKIRKAIERYDVWKPLYVVPPSSVKNAIKASGNADKNKMLECICKLTDLNYLSDEPLKSLDEHSVDSLAVGYSKIKELQLSLLE